MVDNVNEDDGTFDLVCDDGDDEDLVAWRLLTLSLSLSLSLPLTPSLSLTPTATLTLTRSAWRLT